MRGKTIISIKEKRYITHFIVEKELILVPEIVIIIFRKLFFG